MQIIWGIKEKDYYPTYSKPTIPLKLKLEKCNKEKL